MNHESYYILTKSCTRRKRIPGLRRSTLKPMTWSEGAPHKCPRPEASRTQNQVTRNYRVAIGRSRACGTGLMSLESPVPLTVKRWKSSSTSRNPRDRRLVDAVVMDPKYVRHRFPEIRGSTNTHNLNTSLSPECATRIEHPCCGLHVYYTFGKCAHTCMHVRHIPSPSWKRGDRKFLIKFRTSVDYDSHFNKLQYQRFSSIKTHLQVIIVALRRHA